MKKLIKVCCFLAGFSVFAQLTNTAEIEVTYKVKSLKNSDIPESPEASRIIKQMNDFMGYIEFELLANKEKSIFRMKKLLSNENAPEYISNLAIVSCDGNEKWYSDSEESIKFSVISGYEEPTRLNYKQENLWDITNETKAIGSFNCYKAMAKRNEGGRKMEVTAWFAPELPYGFGPIGFDGLPGTIMELHLSELFYFATNVKRNSRKKITKPKYEHEMAYKEYYKKLDKEVGAIKQRAY